MKKIWHFNEFQQTGVDYTDIKKVQEYDQLMQQFRDYKKEAVFILKKLGVKIQDTLLEIGTGTGHFAMEASQKCKQIYALDVSDNMLEYAKNRAQKKGLKNILWIHSGFLSYNFPKQKFNHIVTNAALHHLPDFWKQKSLKNIYHSLKPGGKFYLGDVIFSFNPDEIDKKTEQWINNSKKINKTFYSEAITHIKEEYSTFSWIIEGMLKQVGFKYKKLTCENNFITYLCHK